MKESKRLWSFLRALQCNAFELPRNKIVDCLHRVIVYSPFILLVSLLFGSKIQFAVFIFRFEVPFSRRIVILFLHRCYYMQYVGYTICLSQQNYKFRSQSTICVLLVAMSLFCFSGFSLVFGCFFSKKQKKKKNRMIQLLHFFSSSFQQFICRIWFVMKINLHKNCKLCKY